MNYCEIKRDLFTMENDYYLAHCISDDYALGAGIATEFVKRYDMKNKLLQSKNENPVFEKTNGHCILIDNVLNLVTKQRYWEKPTYDSIRHALISMKDICISNNITHVAMPAIGCGLDRLEWVNVSMIIKAVFNNTGIDIVVCMP